MSTPSPPTPTTSSVSIIVLLLHLFLDVYLRFPAVGKRFCYCCCCCCCCCNVKPLVQVRVHLAFASTYSCGKNTHLSVTTIALWSPVPHLRLGHGHLLTCILLVVLCSLPHPEHMAIDAIWSRLRAPIPFGWLANDPSWSILASAMFWPLLSAWLPLKSLFELELKLQR